ncbi:Response regulator of zinc sigma-54-dependent two-component system [Enhygromyxa salina]|uniref:Response regulator of zinc sigma-54-dependent two-component system n=1 Tax=Enhygromyxa salina TaxID=215803 RepID=A0A0C2CRS3_9BACT|nr:sigma-54 dependent transcriptional regulator [Enhygromyxa salina]KIG13891.1 Response regulator of zinc sigma-54-dependent two-component system [Enhygromyxa salina]
MSRILVVDDEDGVREFMAEVLEDQGYEVDQASDGAAALTMLEAAAYQLLLTDLKMPRLGGMELVRRIRAEQPELGVIVLSAHGSVADAVEAMKLGIFDFLQKPLDSPTQLRLLVARALERQQLESLREATRERPNADPLGYGAPIMEPVVAALRKVAVTDATVLLNGESGTGKEVAARAVHAWSRRADGPFIAVNCAALSANLLESELFGHEKGAFTGASARRRGRIELAAGGSFFLDEVGELDLDLQAKLLRVLQEREFERVGGNQTIRAEVRWIAATNCDLEAMIAAGRFRADLYHRLALFPVHMPALRDRRQDIVPLANRLLQRIGVELGRPHLRLADDAREALEAASWPGNVRELANTLERAAILADGDALGGDVLFALPGRPKSAYTSAPTPTPTGHANGHLQTLAELEQQAILAALEHHDGNRRKAADALGIGLRTLYDKLKRYESGA